jgi:hypothetical protein
MAPPSSSSNPDVEALLELADRPRVQGWTMASALTRYAQPRPALVGQVWEVMRRVLWSLGPGAESAAAEGQGDVAAAVLEAATRLDALGDVLATWAVDRAVDMPDAEVEAAVQEVNGLLDGAGVPHEPREGPPRGRGGRGV